MSEVLEDDIEVDVHLSEFNGDCTIGLMLSKGIGFQFSMLRKPTGRVSDSQIVLRDSNLYAKKYNLPSIMP